MKMVQLYIWKGVQNNEREQITYIADDGKKFDS